MGRFLTVSLLKVRPSWLKLSQDPNTLLSWCSVLSEHMHLEEPQHSLKCALPVVLGQTLSKINVWISANQCHQWWHLLSANPGFRLSLLQQAELAFSVLQLQLPWCTDSNGFLLWLNRLARSPAQCTPGRKTSVEREQEMHQCSVYSVDKDSGESILENLTMFEIFIRKRCFMFQGHIPWWFGKVGRVT